MSTPEHPNKISWTRKEGLCGKNWGWNWITEVDQLKAQQHDVQHLLGNRKSMLQKCCKIKVSGSLGAYPAPLLEMLSRGRGSKRASLSNQGLSGRTIFYANKSFCEQFNDLPPLITEAALLHTQRSRDLLTT